MVEVAQASQQLAWDAFLPEGPTRQHVEAYRRSEWPQIRLELAREYNLELQDEPHWVGPGSAVYWQELVIKERVPDPDGPIQLTIRN